MDISLLACWRRALQCQDWLPVCSTQDRDGTHSKSACYGLMRILTSTLLRPRAAAHLAECPSQLQPDAHSSGCDWMHISTLRFGIVILSWAASVSQIRLNSSCSINHPSSNSALTICET